MFMRFDTVRYTGQKLSGEIGNKIGEVVQRIPTGGYVVDFGNDSYVIADGNLARHFYNDPKERGPEIVRRRKYEVDDE